MNASILRGKTTWQGTPGTLSIDGASFCATLELPWRNNENDLSCVPCGSYECAIYHSPKHGPIYLLQNVPGRSYCEIHPYNWAGAVDHGYKAEALGCIALGTVITKLPPQMMIRNSMVTVDRFMKQMGGKPFTLQISGVEWWDNLTGEAA